MGGGGGGEGLQLSFELKLACREDNRFAKCKEDSRKNRKECGGDLEEKWT